MIFFRKEVLLVFFQSIFLVFVVLFSVVPTSCKISEEGVEIIGGDYENPCLQSVTALDSKNIELQFSDSVKVRDVTVSETIKDVSDSGEHSESFLLSPSIAAACGEFGHINVETKMSDDGKILTVILESEMKIGMKYSVFGTAEDATGNSLTFCVYVLGFNPSVPKMIITEAQIKYGTGKVNGETVYRAEFVELLALEDGNLSGLELLSASDGESKKVVLPPVDVKKGEIILVHPRATEGGGCVNEDGDDLNLATAPHSKDGVRDLWFENTAACYNDNTDVVYLRNSVDNSIMDALLYAKEGAEEWDKKVLPVVNELCAVGICASPDISNATTSKSVTPLKSIARNDAKELAEQFSQNRECNFPFKFDAESWSVCAATPGEIQ